MKFEIKSQNETGPIATSLKSGFTFLALVFLSFSFQNCAPVTSAPKSNETNASDVAMLENKIASHNQLLLNLANGNLSCSSDSDCSTVEVGQKACGGPRGYYVISRNNDFTRLQTLSLELINLETEYNIKQEIMSTCEIPTKPLPKCISNICK